MPPRVFTFVVTILCAALLLGVLPPAAYAQDPAVPAVPAAPSVLLPMVSGDNPAQPVTAPDPVRLPDDPSIEYAPGRLLIKLKPDVTFVADVTGVASAASLTSDTPTLAALLQAYGATTVEPLFAATPASATTAAIATPLAGLYRVALAPDADVLMAARAMATDPAVLYAEPDYVARAAVTPNDTDFALQWALTKIGAPAAWKLSTGNSETIIAFIDSGINLSHEEFQGRLWQNDDPADGGDEDGNGYVDDTNGWNFVTKSRNVADTSGHGSQVAGVAGAASNNGKGVAGMCWQCTLMPVVAMQASGAANYSDIAAAVAYASSNGADIINISLGGYADSQALRDAIAEASVTALVISGAGNDDSSASFYPAAYAQVLAVGATDDEDKKWVGSNYGAWVDVVAPGAGIRTTNVGSNAYITSDGTSLSAAFVSGLAGLVKSRNPLWTPEQVRWQILNTAVDINALNPTHTGQLGAGRIAAQAALATTPQPQLSFAGYAIDGQVAARPAPGQSISLVVTLQNTWLPASNLNATLTSSDGYVTITDNAGTFGAVSSGQTASNTANPFAVTLAANTPYNRSLAFTLNLTGSGGYATSVPFTVQVRSSTFVLGNTQYTTATVTAPNETVVWTNDKTYILDGSVIVGQGVTLTVQAGTVIKVAPDKFIRIDGTLIADGTEEQPIVFTWKTEGQAPWGGIRLMETGEDARYDAGGNWTGGSLLRHTVMSRADHAIFIDGVSTYVANVRLEDNSIGISIGSNSVARIEGCILTRIWRGIAGSDGDVSISGCYFSTLEVAVWGSFSSITQNTFEDISDVAILDCGADNLEITRNVFDRSTISIDVVAYGQVSVSQNLIIHRTHQFASGSNFCANGINGEATARLSEDAAVTGSSMLVEHNTFVVDVPSTAALIVGKAGSSVVQYNNFVGTSPTAMAMGIFSAGVTVDASNNYWGVPAGQIPSRIRDCTFDDNGCGAGATIGKVLWDPPLVSPDQTAPAFVTSVAMNPNPVGLETGTLTVDFSRPMDTSVAPSVMFHDARRGKAELALQTNNYAEGIRDALGRVWFADDDVAVHSYDGNSWTTHPPSMLPSLQSVSSLFAARNGDIWILGIGGPFRFRLGQWTFIPNAPPINRMAEDVDGRLFAISGTVLYGFDGNGWQTLYEGHKRLEDLVIDDEGAVWIASEGNLFTLDGQVLTNRTSELGNAISYISELHGNAEGAIWVLASTTNGIMVFERENASWQKWPIPLLQTALYQLTEDRLGGVWLATDGRLWHCNGSACDTRTIPQAIGGLVIDNFDNLWGLTGNGVAVQWQGLDYLMDSGSWSSAKQWRTTRNFANQIPRGDYVVQVRGGSGIDGITAAPASPYTFTVAYAGGVTTLPPLPPTVQAVATVSLSSLSASWAPNGTGITQYRYAIGTSPTARDVVGWTYLTATSFTRGGLALVSGKTYYITVQARNAGGLWSANGVSNPIVAGVPTTRMLSVSKTGSGSVTSNPAGITCGTVCTEAFPYGASVTLFATPVAGFVLESWDGACSGKGTCTIAMTEERTVTATFTRTGTAQSQIYLPTIQR